MRNIIKKVLSLFSIKVTLINKRNALNQHGINKTNSEILPNGSILLKNFGLTVNEHKHAYIIKGARIMYNLKNKVDASFELNDKDVFIVKIGNLIYNIQTWEELFILNELFVNGVYNIINNKKFTLIDIGMNVAISSLFFAGMPDCLSVYSYEPFRLTFEQALHNISLNDSIKHKIIPFNYGLGNSDKTITVAYDNDIKGNMGVNGIPDHLKNDSKRITYERIHIKDASEILSPIVEAIRKEQTDIILKIDCEGSEYDIFNSFSRSGILKHFKVIVLEWHFKGNKTICAALKEAGYSLFSFNHNDEMSGMIYAFNNNVYSAN